MDEQVLGVCENRVLRGDWRKLRDGELNYWYCPPDSTGVMRSRSIGWEEMGRGEKHPVFGGEM